MGRREARASQQAAPLNPGPVWGQRGADEDEGAAGPAEGHHGPEVGGPQDQAAAAERFFHRL